MTPRKNLPPLSKETPKKPNAPSKGETSHGIRVVGRSELERRGWDISDELVISLGRTKRPGPLVKSPKTYLEG